MKDSGIVYRNFMKAVRKLPVEKQGAAYEAYLLYAMDGEDYSGEDVTIAALLEAFRSFIDEDREKYDAKCSRAKKAAESKSEQNRNNIESISDRKQNDIVTDTDTVTDTDIKEKDSKESKKKSSAFRRPTLDEVRAYCLERGNNVDPQTFVDFYEAKGWKVGSQPMKDWKACVRTWEQRNRGDPPKNAGITRGTDFDALIRRRL